MNDQLQQAVTTLIEKSLRAFEAGADFMAGQIPDVVHQLLVWHMALSAVKCGAAVLLMIALVIVDWKLFKYAKKVSEETRMDEALYLGWGAIGSLARIPAWLATLGLLNLTWLQIWLAPKIFLIEYAAKVVAK